MKRIILIFSFFLLISFNSYSQDSKSYKINYINLIDSKISNEIIEIRELPKGQYQSNSFYVKLKHKCDDIKVREVLKTNCLQNNINDFELKSITQPFQIDIPLNKVDIGLKNIFLIVYNSNVNVYDICKNLATDFEVEYSSPIFARYINDSPNDPKISEQYFLNKIQAFQAWDVTKGDSNIVVGFVDSGVNFNHPDLIDKIFINTKEIPNDGLDNDKNGFIDDVNGWDFIGDIGWLDADYSKWKPDNNVIPNSPSNNHGTHVAGIATASTNNAIGIAGIAPNCRFLPVKCALDNMDGNTGGSNRIFRGFEGISYLAKMGARVISCSWSGEGFSPVEQDIVNQLSELGIIIVSAAGNDGVLLDRIKLFPASYYNVISVGASDQTDLKASYSQFGLSVSIYAPGSAILSTIPDNAYLAKSGTSMATPVVSGAIALLMSINPAITFKQIYHQLRSTSDNVLTQDPNLRPFYFGRLNLLNLLSYNNPKFPTKSVPGISVDYFKVNDTTFLKSNEPSSLKLVIKNYLSKATNISILISEFDSYVSIKNNYFTVNYLDKGDSIVVTPVIQLSNDNPWYKGSARFVIYFKGDNGYTDYELLEIPINIESTNKFAVAEKFPVYHDIVWKKAISKSDYNFMSVGYYNDTGNGIYYCFLDQVPFQLLGGDTLSAIDKYGNNIIFLGTKPAIGTAKLLKSFNKGGNWQAQTLTGLTSVNHVQFIDSSNIWLFGETSGGSFGVAKSQNAGTSWTILDNLPAKLQYSGLAIEKMSENAIKIKDNIMFFGTNYGRTISTGDSGKTWTITNNNDTLPSMFMEFTSKQNGIQVYRAQNTSDYTIKFTQDTGKNWEKSDYTFQNQNLIPVYIYAPDSSKMIVMLCRGGEVLSTTDLGRNWKNELTDEYFFNNLQTGAGFTTTKGVRLWNSGYDFTYLDLEKVPLITIKKLSSLSQFIVDFDSLKLSSSKDTLIFLQNKGNTPLKILNVSIMGQNFSIDTNFKKILLPNDIISIKISFKGLLEGIYQSKLIIKSDSDFGDLTFDIKGIVFNPTSVYDNPYSQTKINYNQINKNIELSFSEVIDNNLSYEIIDLNGITIQKDKLFLLGKQNRVFIPFNKNSGIFFLKIYSYGMNFTSKFLVID